MVFTFYICVFSRCYPKQLKKGTKAIRQNNILQRKYINILMQMILYQKNVQSNTIYFICIQFSLFLL